MAHFYETVDKIVPGASILRNIRKKSNHYFFRILEISKKIKNIKNCTLESSRAQIRGDLAPACTDQVSNLLLVQSGPDRKNRWATKWSVHGTMHAGWVGAWIHARGVGRSNPFNPGATRPNLSEPSCNPSRAVRAGPRGALAPAAIH